MTNKPEPNTRAGEALLDSAVEQMGEALFNLSSRLKLAGTFTAGSPGDRNAVSYEKVVLAWQKLTGEIERSKLPTWDHYAEEHVDTRPLPQPSELVERPDSEIMAFVRDSSSIIIGARIAQLEAQIAKLQADGDKLAEALKRSRTGWANVLELGLLPVTHEDTALDLGMEATQALTEWKDQP